MIYINDANFELYAARYYDNPSCATRADFLQDLNRIKFIMKMFKRYEKDGNINERLVLNHLILLYNVFEREAATKMLVFKLDKYLPMLKPFLVLLNFWPERITHIDCEGGVIIGSNIPMDMVLVEKLRRI